MKIAIVHNNGPGGAVRAVAATARGLTERGHEVDVWTLAPPARAPSLETRAPAAYEPLLDLGQLTIAASPLARLEEARLDRAWAHLAAAVNATRPDVVLGQGCRYVEHPRLRGRLEAPLVAYLHDVPRFTGASSRPEALWKRAALCALSPWYRRLARATRVELEAARVVVANSRYTQERHERELGIRSTVVHPGVAPDVFRPLGLERERFVFCPGALHRRKRQALLVAALGMLPAPERVPLLLMYPAANPGYLRGLGASARSLGVELVLRPSPTEDELVAAYNRASLVLYPSADEPFGLVPLEAMACGTTVVAAAEGGVLETIEHERTGLLVAGTAEAFAGAIARLLADPASREGLATAGRSRVLERWTWERCAGRLEAILDGVVRP